MNKRKVYAAPEAEMILLAPVEGLAAWDWDFKSNWQNTWHSGYFKKDGVLSAVGIINGGQETPAGIWEEDGFVIK